MDHSHWVLFSTSTTKVHVAQALNVSLMPIALIDFHPFEAFQSSMSLVVSSCSDVKEPAWIWICICTLRCANHRNCTPFRTLWDIWKWQKLCFWTQMQQKRSYLFCIFNDISHYLKESEKHRTSMAFVEGWQEKALYIQKKCKSELNVIQLKLRF